MLKNALKPTLLKKNLLIALTGTGLAQLIHLGTTPIISRIFEPEYFGKFALFNSLLGVITAFSLFKMDLAIMSAEDDEIHTFKKIIFKLGYITAFLTLVFFLLHLLFRDLNLAYLFLAIAIIPSNKFWTYKSIQNRLGNYKRLSIGKIIENITNAFFSISFGILGLKEFGLIFGKVLGLFSNLLFLKDKSEIKVSKNQKELMNKYKEFPKYSFPGEILGHLNVNASVFIFAYLFSPVEVGFIGLTTRVLSMPVNFISVTFCDVFKQKAMSDYKTTGEFETIFVKFFFMLAFISISMISVIYFFSEDLFVILFGDKWLKAGTYAKYLCFLYAIRLIVGSLAYSFEINKKNHWIFIFQIAYLLIGVSSLLISYSLTNDDIFAIKTYSYSLASIYLMQTLFAYINARNVSKGLSNG